MEELQPLPELPKETKTKPTVAILTNFMDFNPGYSLSGIIVDQAKMLLRKGHKVIVFVNEQFNPKMNEDAGITNLEKYPGFLLLKRTKFMHLDDYISSTKISKDHIKQAEQASEIYLKEFLKHEVDTVFTHDFVFTGWNLPYSLSIKNTHNKIKGTRSLRWFHWVHSTPTNKKDWWQLRTYGDNHFIVFPNKTEIMRVAEAYSTNPSNVRIIPHIKDIRSHYDFLEGTWDITDAYKNIMNAKVVQVYPCSTDRLHAKQLNIVIEIFGNMKEANVPVFLFVVNQWATGRQQKENLKPYIELGESYGLEYQKDFIFSSSIRSEYEAGLSKRMLRELTLLSNVFIFPTREESFGLVGPEAALSGCLPVINKSLTMQLEVMGTECPAFDFGSFHHDVNDIKNPEYIKAISMAILNRLYSNEALMTKTYTKNRYNMDNLYNRYYLPFI